MLPLIQFIAVLATTIFSGAAIYINLVEHPARMGCSTELAATEWASSYKRATLMQAPLAIIGFLCGIGAWWLGAGVPWRLLLHFSFWPSSLSHSSSSSPQQTNSCSLLGVTFALTKLVNSWSGGVDSTPSVVFSALSHLSFSPGSWLGPNRVPGGV